MSEPPLVSIVIPVYNVLLFLRESLDSVVGQTYRNLEIIVIDDGSTDGSDSVCDEYSERDPRVRVTHQQNAGLSAARNVGIDVATGDYLLFLDADDWIELNAVETLLREAVLTDADVVCCRHVTVQAGRSVIKGPSGRAAYDGQQALEALVCRGELGNVAWGKLYRTSTFRGIRYPEGRVYEDAATTWRVLGQANTVVRIPDALFHYRVREGSISSCNDMDNLIDCWIANKERYEALSQRFPQMRLRLAEGCLLAIGRVWCWYGSCPKRDREEHVSKIDEMVVFVREHASEVLRGGSPIKIKAFALVCRWSSPLSFASISAANSLRRLLNGMVHGRKNQVS